MIRALAAMAIVLSLVPLMAQSACRQALALGLDVSGSVDSREYRLQLDGLATALTDPVVQAAFLAMPQAPVRLMVFEWSGLHEQRELIGWTEVTSADRLNRVAAQLLSTRAAHINDPSTATGAAMLFGAQALAQQSGCWKRTLDLSGDGAANIGKHPGDLTEDQLGPITINGLVIGPDARANTTKNLHNVKSLEGYYRSFVLRGPGAFSEVAIDYDDFTDAMRRKLLREVDAPALSHLGSDAPAPRPGLSRYSVSGRSSNALPGAAIR